MDSLINVIVSILKSNFIAIIIVFMSFVIESFTDFKFLIKDFKWKKSLKNARIHRNGNQVYYFILTSIVYAYDLYKGNLEFTFIAFAIWLAILITLSTILGKIYDKYQGVDPNKADDDYT